MRSFFLVIVLNLLVVSVSYAGCSDIKILERGMDVTDLALGDVFSLVDPGPNQKQIVEDAKAYFSDLHCQAVTRIAFLNEDGEDGTRMAWVGGTVRDLLNIAATSSKASETNLGLRTQGAIYKANLVSTLVHEATHAADNLLNFVAPRREVQTSERLFSHNEWSSGALSLAKNIIKINLLDRGLRHEWKQIHERAVQLDFALPYHHQGDSNMSADEIIKMGVASGYGGDEAAEDIAEMTAGIIAARAWPQYGAIPPTPAEDLICERMQAVAGPGIPGELALIYAKVGLLNSVDLISDLEYDYCVGNLKIRAPGNGFFTLKNQQQTNTYTGNVQGRIGHTADGTRWAFQLEATGLVDLSGEGEKQARIELTIPLAPASEPRPSFPRGIYGIGRGINGVGAGATINIYYRDEGKEKLAVTAESGLVLVSRASTKLVEGSISIARFVNWTSLLAMPESAGDMVITFRKKN